MSDLMSWTFGRWVDLMSDLMSWKFDLSVWDGLKIWLVSDLIVAFIWWVENLIDELIWFDEWFDELKVGFAGLGWVEFKSWLLSDLMSWFDSWFDEWFDVLNIW